MLLTFSLLKTAEAVNSYPLNRANRKCCQNSLSNAVNSGRHQGRSAEEKLFYLFFRIGGAERFEQGRERRRKRKPGNLERERLANLCVPTLVQHQGGKLLAALCHE